MLYFEGNRYENERGDWAEIRSARPFAKSSEPVFSIRVDERHFADGCLGYSLTRSEACKRACAWLTALMGGTLAERRSEAKRKAQASH